ncbi:unnamed protein product [marine sediment metagenome]|uniref:Uncharacterized protein n=1 Tax=marine sediment metagenome TaxID=412755 RepID=X1L135_9ZZZZ
MQILDAGGLPVASDAKRKPDRSNPKGYLEVESIIDKLRDNPDYVFNFEDRVLKVIAYGLQSLPPGNYKLIYMDRNIEEILDSMEKMMRARDEERDDTKKAFIKLNNKTKADIKARGDMQVLFVNYNEILSNPKKHLEDIHCFLEEKNLDLEKMIEVVDEKLYRQRRER